MLHELEKFETILKILKETEPDILPDMWYHRNCQSIFTIKKDLERIKKVKQTADSGGTSSQVATTRSIISPTSELLLHIKCLISSKLKFIRVIRTQEKLILCTNLQADQTLKMVGQQKRLETFSLLETSGYSRIVKTQRNIRIRAARRSLIRNSY